MSYEIEKAKSNRSKCSNCSKSINLGELRVNMDNFVFGFGKGKKTLCKECGISHIKAEINELIKQLGVLNE